MKYILLIASVFILSGCVKDVKPWEKGNFAKDTMKDGGINPLIKAFEEHTFFSKEATKTGNGVAGGGCGCN